MPGRIRSRGIFPLKRFFVGGTVSAAGEEVAWDVVRLKLQEIVDQENKQHPLSDDELVKELAKAGLTVARRTVTKYRKAMDIPSSRQRRDWTLGTDEDAAKAAAAAAHEDEADSADDDHADEEVIAGGPVAEVNGSHGNTDLPGVSHHVPADNTDGHPAAISAPGQVAPNSHPGLDNGSGGASSQHRGGFRALRLKLVRQIGRRILRSPPRFATSPISPVL